MTRTTQTLLFAIGILGCWKAPEVGERLEEEQAVVLRSFAQLEGEVFAPSCGQSYCHGGGATQYAPMSLEAGKAYDNLVNANSVETSMKRVTPGDPAQSYLLFKLRGRGLEAGGTGTQMPLNRAPLPSSVIREIEEWINRGAPND
jgi:hypothetical protein